MYRRVVTFALLGLAVLGILALLLLWYSLRGGQVNLPELPALLPSATPSPYVVTRTPTPSAPWTPGPTQPGSTPSATPVAIPGGWQLFESRELPLVLAYPPEWQPEEQGQGGVTYRGAGGFFRLEYFNGHGVRLDQACEYQANTFRGYYGQTPELVLTEINGLPACLIRTSLSGSRAESAALITTPGEEITWEQRFLLLRADVLHFEDLFSSAQAAGGRRIAAVTAAPFDLTPAPTPSGLLPQRERTWNGLRWIEQRIVAEELDTPAHFEFLQRLPPDLEEQRALAEQARREVDLAQVNDLLGSFGYALEGEPAGPLRLVSSPSGETLLGQVFDFHPPSRNQSGSDFALVLDAAQGYYLLQASGLQPWDAAGAEFTPPVYLGDRLVAVAALPGAVQVLLDWEPVYRHALTAHMVESPVKALGVVGERWVLLVNGLLVVDGAIQNQSGDYDEVFGWQQLAGQPFFFFVRDGRVGLHWNGQDLPDLYEEVVHDRCCEPALFNIESRPNLVRFFARAEGYWWLGELAPQEADGL